MPLENVLVLALITGAFVIFALFLAFADVQSGRGPRR